MKETYRKTIISNKAKIKQQLFSSLEFKKEDSFSYRGQQYTSASMNMVYINTTSDNNFEFSENCGLGGILEVIAHCKLNKISVGKTELELQFKFGIFNVNLPQNILIVLLVAGILLLLYNPILGLIILGLSIIPLILMMSKKMTMNLILKKIAKSLDIENSWN